MAVPRLAVLRVGAELRGGAGAGRRLQGLSGPRVLRAVSEGFELSRRRMWTPRVAYWNGRCSSCLQLMAERLLARLVDEGSSREEGRRSRVI